MLGDPEPLCSALMASEERAQDSSLAGSLSALGGNLYLSWTAVLTHCMALHSLTISDESLNLDISLIPRPRPAFCRLQYGKAVEGLEYFIT